MIQLGKGYKEKPFDWRTLLTRQSTEFYLIPREYLNDKDYVEQFEKINCLVPTVPHPFVSKPPNKRKRK